MFLKIEDRHVRNILLIRCLLGLIGKGLHNDRSLRKSLHLW